MIASDLILDTYRAYRGKPDARTPVWGSDKANVALAIANRKITEWATDPRNKWASLFETSSQNEPGTVATTGTTALTGTDTYFTDYNVGDKITVDGETVRTIDTIVSDTSLTVTVAFSNTASGVTFTKTTIVDETIFGYNLHRNFFASSDYARVTKTDNSIIDYPIAKVTQRGLLEQSLYVHGLNPRKITFAQTMDSSIDGATLSVPGYYIPDSLVNQTDVVPVDDPLWLVYITASELARNDAAKDDQFATLVGMANERYLMMSNNNNDTGFLQPNNVVNNMPQIGDSITDWWTA